MIQADIYLILSTSPAISGICSGRIYPQRLPQGATVPAVVYTINEINPIVSLSGESGLDSGRIEIICWAQNYTAAHLLATTVRAAFASSGIATLIGSMEDTEDEETHNFGVVMNMSAWSDPSVDMPPPKYNKFVPFHYLATEGQTEFELDSAPMANGILLLAINGIVQSQPKGDFDIDGVTITLSEGLNAGDILAGCYAQSV